MSTSRICGLSPTEHDVLPSQRFLLDGLGQHLEQLDVLPRLADEVVGAQAHRLDRCVDVGVPGQHDELRVDVGAAGPAQDVETGVIGKANVDEDHVELVTTEDRHRVPARRGFDDRHLCAREHARQKAADVGVVVHDERADPVLHVALMIAPRVLAIRIPKCRRRR
jgi:hypothetical protein